MLYNIIQILINLALKSSMEFIVVTNICYKILNSSDNVLRIAEVIVTLEADLPKNGKTLTRTIYTSQEKRDIAYLIETADWLNPIG